MTTEIVMGILTSLLASALLFILGASVRIGHRRVRGLRGRLRLARQASDSGIIHIFSTRADYQRFRGTATLADYFRLARRRIEVVGHSLNYGQQSQGIADELESMLEANPSLEIDIALIDPNSTHIGSVALYLKGLGRSQGPLLGSSSSGVKDAEKWFRSQVVGALQSLFAARVRMPSHLRARFRIKVYDTLPVASVIMLDRGYESGRTQIDIKLYGSPYQRSVSFELGKGGQVYNAVTEAWGNIIDHAEILDYSRHLPQDGGQEATNPKASRA